MTTNQWLNLTGTQSGQLQLGIGGPKIIAENGNLNVRNAANNGFTTVNAANVVVHNNTTGFSMVLGVPDGQTSNTLLILPPNNGLAGQYLSTDGTGNASWSYIPTGGLANGLSTITIPAANGNVNTSVGGNANVLVVTSTGIEVTSNVLAGNANITSNLTTANLEVTGNVLIGGDTIVTGNLDVLGSLNTTSTNSFSVVSPIIELGTGPNGNSLTTNDGMDRGVILDYYTSAPVQAFIGWKNADSEFIFGSNVSNVNNIITVNDYGNIVAGTIFANLTGNLANGTSTASIPAANGNINLSVNGTANVVVVASTGITVTGNANVDTLLVTGNANLGNIGNLTLIGGSNGQFLKTDGVGNLTWATVGSNALVNGNSNITIMANADVNISANSVANVVSISEQGANITGNLKVSGVTRLGSLGNVKITGGTLDQFIKTDGTGNLVFADPSAIALVNGNTNVTTTANGNVTVAVTGTANVLVISQTGTQTLGNSNVTGNITATGTLTTVDANITGNLLALNANVNGLLAANVAQANLLTVSGNTTLANVGVTGNALFTGNLNVTGNANLGANGNITILGGSNGQVLSTDGSGNLSWLAVGTPNALVNGNSNVTVLANSSILLSVGGFANIVTVSTAGITVVGESNLGNLGNVKILGGTANYLLQTDGNGNLTWIAPPSATSIINGNSNVVVSANGNVSTSVAGNANVFVVTGTGANLQGNLAVTANLTSANANVTGNLSANNAAIANILTANTANIAANLTASNANITTLLTAANANVTSNLTTANANVTGMLTAANANVAGTITANIANITTRVTTGNANITTLLTTANANVTTLLTALDANVTANLTTANANVTANLTAVNANITGNLRTANLTATGEVTLGAVDDITITGGANLQVLQTDGNGNLQWATVGGSALVVKSNGAEIATTANTLDFTGAGGIATANGNIVTVEILGASAIIQQTIEFTSPSTGNGLQFTNPGVSNLVSNSQSSVFVNGVLARISDFTVAGNTITFNRILRTGDTISAQPVNVTMSTPQTGISNGNSAVAVTANGNIGLTASGNLGLTITANGMVASGTADLGSAANLRLSGGSNNQFLLSEGNGRVSWSSAQLPGASQVVKMTTCGYNGMLTLMADGRLYLTRGQQSGGYACYYDTMKSTGQFDSFYGVEATHEILQPYTDTGKIIDAGVYGSSAYMLMDNGNLYTWGYNGQGQLGVGDVVDRYQPTLASTSVAQVYTDSTNANRANGFNKLIIRKTDGTIWGCGYNAFGQLGIGNTTNQLLFVQITLAGTNPRSVWNMGGYIGCLVVQKSDGKILVAGYNGTGQLGNNTTANILTLTEIAAWQPPTDDMLLNLVTGGFGYFSDAANESAVLFMWYKGILTDLIRGSGTNSWGNLATGNLTQSRVPVTITIPGTGRIQQFSAVGGSPTACHVLRDSGRLYAWGYNAVGQLGLGDLVNKTAVTFVMTDVLGIELANQSHTTTYDFKTTSYIRKADGYYASGQAYEGQTGTGNDDVAQITTFTRMRLPAGITIAYWGRNIQNSTRWNIFMVDTLGRWWACGWTAGYSISNQAWIASDSSIPSPMRVMPYNLLFNRF